MRIKNWSVALFACSIVVAGAAQADQKVDLTNVSKNGTAVAGSPPAPIFVKAGDLLKFDATLTCNGPSPACAATDKNPGIGLCLEYALAQAADPTIGDIYGAPGTPAPRNTGEYFGSVPPAPQNAPNCTAGGSSTIVGADRVIITPFTSIGGNFPASGPLPVKLYDATFTIPATFTGGTRIGFAASSTATGQAFASNGPVSLCASPTVTVAKVADAAEPATNGSFSVTLSAAVPAACGTGGNFPVTLTLSGTATPAVDYNAAGTGVAFAAPSTVTVTFPADGATVTRTVSINVIDDSLIEGTETVILTVAAGSGNYGGVATSASLNIADDDSGVSVVVTQDGAEATPATSPGIFTFTRTVTGAPLTVTFTLSGTATTPADYAVTPGTGATAATTTSITFAAASATAQLIVNVVDDVLVEGTETVILTGANGAGYAFTGTNPVTMNIADNDTPPVVSVSAKTDGAEPSTNGSFTLTRAGNPTPAVNVNVTVAGTATRGTDYTLSTAACAANTPIVGNSFTIPAAATTLVINMCVIDDSLVEGTETVILTVVAPTVATDYTIGAPTTQTANITDDDGPVTVTVVATTPNAAEPATNGLFTVTRSGGGAAQLAQPLTVNLVVTGTATNGIDYVTIAATVIIPANAGSAPVPVTVIDDTLFEGNETVILTIGAGTYTVGAASTATVTIADNEVGVGVAATVPNTIEGGTLSFTINCSTNVGTFNVNYAFSGSYTPLPANVANVAVNCATGLVVSVPTIDDAIQNGTRTIVLTVTAAGPAPGSVDPARASVTGTVLDNDVPRIIPTMSPIGMLLMGLLLAAAAGLGMRRKA